jgi:hypothetical protein
MHAVVTWLLLANAVWDFLCAIAMFVDWAGGARLLLADAHFGLWRLDADRCDNPAAKLLFAVLVLQWGVTRCLAAATADLTTVLVSYEFEALLLTSGAAAGLMGWRKAFGCTLLCA